MVYSIVDCQIPVFNDVPDTVSHPRKIPAVLRCKDRMLKAALCVAFVLRSALANRPFSMLGSNDCPMIIAPMPVRDPDAVPYLLNANTSKTKSQVYFLLGGANWPGLGEDLR